MDTVLLTLAIIFLLFFQMATLNFNCILLMLADQGSIPWTPSRARTDSTWGKFASVPHGEPFACSASLLTICRDSSPRVCSCPPHRRALLSSVGLLLFSWSSRWMANMRGSLMSMWDLWSAGWSPACIPRTRF